MKDFAVLVNSCDAYADLWPVFFRLLKLNWPETERLNVYLNTETTKQVDAGITVKTVNTEIKGKDQWGKRLLNSLSLIKEDYVVVLMDDFYLREPVVEEKIKKCIEAFEKNPDIAVFYLKNTFKNDFEASDYEGFGKIPKKTNFRLNSAPALWRKQKLIEYTAETDNPWAWEYFGSCRTDKTNDLFLCALKDKPVYDYAHAIYRGKWLEKDVAPLIEKYNLNIDTSVRGVVKENEPAVKRSLGWKIKFLCTGIKMVGFDAVKEVYRDIKHSKS